MIHQYEPRWATYEGSDVRDVTDTEKQSASFAPLPRYWVDESEVDERLGDYPDKLWLLAFRDIARSTDERTSITSLIPRAAVGHTAPLVFGLDLEIIANQWSSVVYDYVTRQKVGGTHLTYTYIRQLPSVSRSIFGEPAPWDLDTSVGEWVGLRSLELNSTSHNFKLSDAIGSPFVWDVSRRELLRAEVDAAFFHLYGVNRADTEYILGTFSIVKRKDDAAHGEYRTQRLILEIYDAIELAMQTGAAYQTNLDPPPGHGARHTAQEAVI